MNTKSDLLSKNWFLVCYHSLDTSMIGGLRISRLSRYLSDKGIKVNLITRESYTDTLESITIIPEKKIVQRNKRLFNLITPPDSSAIWSLSVFKFLRKKKPGVILTTVPPFGIVFVGLLLRLFRSRHYWVADFRDPWFLNPVYKPAFYWYKRIVAYILESIVFKTADLVILNTFKDQENYIKKYPFLKSKSLVVRNGFDEKIENRARKINTHETIRMVYSGTAYQGGIATINVAAFLNKLNNAGLSIICDYYGEYHPSIELSPFIEYKGRVPQDQIPKILSYYKLGLIYLQEVCIGGGRVTQKFYDYLGSGVSPIVLNPSQEMSTGMRALNFGLEVYPDSPIENIITYIQSSYFSEQSALPENAIKPYTREYQFEKLFNSFID